MAPVPKRVKLGVLVVLLGVVVTAVVKGGKVTTICSSTWGRFTRRQDAFFDFSQVSFVGLFSSLYVLWIFRNWRRHLFIEQQDHLSLIHI